MKKNLIFGLISFLIGAIICGALFLCFQPRPGPAKATINPTPKEEKKADQVYSIKQTGKVGGWTPLPPAPVPVPADPLRPAAAETKPGLFEGQSVTVPIEGQITTVITDKHTGQEIGRGVHPVTGETVVTVERDRVLVDTIFQDEFVMAVDVVEASKKKNELGAIYTGETIAYYKRELVNLNLSKVEVAPWVGAAYNFDDNKASPMVGLSVRW